MEETVKRKIRKCKPSLRPKYDEPSDMNCTYCGNQMWNMRTADGGYILGCKNCEKLKN